MSTAQLSVPALPVLVPLGFLLMAVSWIVLRRRGENTPGRLAVCWLGGWYAVAVLGATLLPLHLSWGPGAGPATPYRIVPVALTTAKPIDFVLNVAMTVPIAVFLHLVLGVRDRRRVVLTGFLLSAT